MFNRLALTLGVPRSRSGSVSALMRSAFPIRITCDKHSPRVPILFRRARQWCVRNRMER